MNKDTTLQRIELNPEVMAGKPVIKGTRLTVQSVLNQLANGATNDDILKEYHGLSEEDIQACLLYASKMIESTDFVPFHKAI